MTNYNISPTLFPLESSNQFSENFTNTHHPPHPHHSSEYNQFDNAYDILKPPQLLQFTEQPMTTGFQYNLTYPHTYPQPKPTLEECTETKEQSTNNNNISLLYVKFNLLKDYMLTFQTCNKCGQCFQNRHKIYQGKYPYCKKCRRFGKLTKPLQNPKQEGVLIQCKIFYMYNDNSKMEFTEQYIIPAKDISPEMIQSIQHLNNTRIIQNSHHNPKITFENEHGRLFHENFQREQYQINNNIHNNINNYNIVFFCNYCKEIYYN
jgi:hypothetical protein